MTDDPRFDIELRDSDLHRLSSADAIAAFFAKLRYATSARTAQTPAALGISSAVARPINRIELIAESDLLQVYLVELSSVTVKATRDLVRSFRDRAGNFLFVLTSDYQRIDFVLLDWLPFEGAGAGLKPVTNSVRPRILSLDRRHPSALSLRVLRRFTWTEIDGFAQYDKIRSAYSMAEWSEEEGLFNNRALFSDHYLKHRLPDDQSWQEDAATPFRSLRDLFLGRDTFQKADEATLRKALLEPAFAALGFHARPVRQDPGDSTQPDYELYSNEESGEQPLAYCLSYPWARYLDGKDESRDLDTPNENPGAVVVSLLQNRDVPWVIVTNGKLWRLYSKRTHSRATSFFEIDLEEKIAEASASNPDPFRYFWLLFRRQAFELVTITREERVERVPFLDRLLLESDDYAKGLGERLKSRVFEKVFPHLASGFMSRWNGEVTEDDLLRTYRAILTLLYRLLFLLYGEARDLLPVRELRGYYGKSLEKLKKDIAEKAGAIEDEIEANLEKSLDRNSTAFHERLSELFAIVDAGNSDLNVPFYNGGLFSTDPAEDDESDEADASRFLRAHAVPDRELAAAIDLLAREDDPKYGRIFLDYKSLGVRHLGSIYEGLLEFRLRFASERLGIVREKGRDLYKAWKDIDDRKRKSLEKTGRIVKKGELYLENDKHERKATGSYYTPDHIVKYIVEHAVGPVLAEKLEALRPRLREAQAWRREAPAASKAKGESVQRNYDWGHLIEEKWGSLIDDVFDIKVLDPAMGSGHFLVEAVDFITDRILDFLNAFPWNPVMAHLRWTRETILKEMERQSISIDPGKLTDVNLLKRHVLKRCVYGVDLNPMAVELAKVSLWLDCFTLGAPLSFLDHHLRCGNSLVGVTVEEVDRALKGGTQAHLFSGNRFAGVKNSVAGMIAIGDLPDITPEEVRNSRNEYHRALSATRWAKRLLDVYTSQWFGNAITRGRRGKKGTADRNPALEFLGDRASEVWAEHGFTDIHSHFQTVADISVRAAIRNRFFHWELEFPEVFYRPSHRTGDGMERIESVGFDAVIGNPPYDEPSEYYSDTTDELLEYFDNYPSYAAVKKGRTNLYRLFIVRGMSLAGSQRYLSFIVPLAVLGDDFSLLVRRWLLEDHSFRSIEAFPQKDDSRRRVFSEAKLSTAALCIQRGVSNRPSMSVRTHPGKEIELSSPSYTCAPSELLALFPRHPKIPTVSSEEFNLIRRIEFRDWPALAQLGRIYVGEVFDNAPNKKYLTDAPTEALVARGANVDRYRYRSQASQGAARYLLVSKFAADKSRSEKLAYLGRPRIGIQRGAAVDMWRRLIACIVAPGQFSFCRRSS